MTFLNFVGYYWGPGTCHFFCFGHFASFTKKLKKKEKIRPKKKEKRKRAPSPANTIWPCGGHQGNKV